MTDAMKEIVRALARTTGRPEETILPDHHLINDLELDSLDRVELMMKIEDLFSISVSDAEAENLVTVRQVAEFVQARIDSALNS